MEIQHTFDPTPIVVSWKAVKELEHSVQGNMYGKQASYVCRNHRNVEQSQQKKELKNRSV